MEHIGEVAVATLVLAAGIITGVMGCGLAGYGLYQIHRLARRGKDRIDPPLRRHVRSDAISATVGGWSIVITLLALLLA